MERRKNLKDTISTFSAQLFVTMLLSGALCTAQSNELTSSATGENGMDSQVITKWQPPYPLNEEEVYQGLLQILRTPVGELSREKVESVFHMKMLNSDRLFPDPLNADPRWYKVFSRAAIDWYFSVGVTVGPELKNFAFTWWDWAQAPKLDGAPMCLDTNRLTEDIRASQLGWVEKVPDPLEVPDHGPIYDHSFYKTNGDHLFLRYQPSNNCLSMLSFSINTNIGAKK